MIKWIVFYAETAGSKIIRRKSHLIRIEKGKEREKIVYNLASFCINYFAKGRLSER